MFLFSAVEFVLRLPIFLLSIYTKEKKFCLVSWQMANANIRIINVFISFIDRNTTAYYCILPTRTCYVVDITC